MPATNSFVTDWTYQATVSSTRPPLITGVEHRCSALLLPSLGNGREDALETARPGAA